MQPGDSLETAGRDQESRNGRRYDNHVSTSDILNVFQILIALVVIAAVVLQAKGAGLGNIFGGVGGDSYRTRRGLERTLFRGTIVLMLVFVGLSIAAVRI